MGTAPHPASSAPLLLSVNPSHLPIDREQSAADDAAEEFDLVRALRESASDNTHPVQSVLDAIASAARVLSGADGTALALPSKAMIVCRARNGDMAPGLGAPMNAETGISGACLRRATMLVCHDASTDSRVDNEVCRGLGIRSIVAVPVRGAAGASGILEAFSSRPNAFDGDALNSLRALAEVAADAYQRESPEPGLVIKPLSPAPHPTTYSTPPLAAEEILGKLPEPGRVRIWMVVGIAIVLLAVVAVAWWSWQVPADETASGAQSAPAASANPAHPVERRETLPKPAPGVLPRRSEGSRPEVIQNAAGLESIPLKSDVVAPADTENTSGANAGAAASDVPSEPPKVELVPSANSEELARLVSIPAQLPSAGPRVSEGVVEPALIHRVAPSYPMQARTERLSGTVILSAMIDTDGTVREIAVLSGPPILADAAKTAVRQWRYRPATLNSSPIAIQKEITVLFTLPN